MSKAKSIALWTSLILASLMFVMAGVGKLMGVEQMHVSFATLGLPVWFGYFIGVSEAVGAVALWKRNLSFYSAAGLFIIMLGAAYYHVRFEAFVTVVPAVILLGLLTHIMYVRYQDRIKF